MSEQASAIGWVVEVRGHLPDGSRTPAETFDVTYPTQDEAVEAVKRHCGTGPNDEIEVLHELVATDLGPRKVRRR